MDAQSLARGIRGAVLGSALLLAACGSKDGGPTGPSDGPPGDGAEGPGTPVPAELLGTWYTGNVSSVNFFQPSTGHWDNAGGTGLFYSIKADGTYEFGWRLYSQLYSCSMTVLVYKSGTVEVDPAGGSLVLHPTYGRMHSEDNCNSDGNYDKDAPLDEETVLYELGQDDYGNLVLLLRYPDGEASAFYPQDE